MRLLCLSAAGKIISNHENSLPASRSRQVLSGVLILLSISFGGCSQGETPPLASVHGVVKYQGVPLPHAFVEFIPENGRPSVGETEEDGHYQLRYTSTQNGALLGHHHVRITTGRPTSGGEGDEPSIPAVQEKLPEKYHSRSELSANVVVGTNEINFNLQD